MTQAIVSELLLRLNQNQLEEYEERAATFANVQALSKRERSANELSGCPSLS